MFAIVRTGGKQYRVSPGDKIVVEKLAGEAGDSITLSDVLLAGDGSDLKGTDGLTIAAEIVAQAKGEKVIVFKKRRRHNYRRKKGHRQQHTILKIVSIGGQGQQAAPAQAAAAPAKSDAPAASSDTAATDTNSTQDAAPAKGSAKKTPKA
jgi:large subunit ribosomal protein L21